jgi:hypothetical protein
MDIERRKNEFKEHHKHPMNLLFHLFCGIIYTALFFSLFPSYVYVVYVVFTLYLFPNVGVLLLLAVLPLLAQSFRLSNLATISAIILFYFAPDITHYLTKEETVLNINTVTVYDLIDNFFFLLPHTILCLLPQLNVSL